MKYEIKTTEIGTKWNFSWRRGGNLALSHVARSDTETLSLVSTDILKIKEDSENSNPVNPSWLYLKLVSDILYRNLSISTEN